MSKINRSMVTQCILALVLLIASLILISAASGLSAEEKLIKSAIASADKGNYKDMAKKLGFTDIGNLLSLDTFDYNREDTLSMLGISATGSNAELGTVQVNGFYETGDEKSKTVKALITVHYTDHGESKTKNITSSYDFSRINGKWTLSW